MKHIHLICSRQRSRETAGRKEPMNNILHLKYAVEVEKAGSISRAAETLFLAQPHLSKAIRELESSLGAAIFKRTSRGVIPTVRGKEFLRRARVVLKQLEGMEEVFRPSSSIRHALDLCVPPACYLSDALSAYLQSLNPDKEVDIHFRHSHANGTMNRVADGENDWGILRYQTIYEPYYRKALQDKELRYKEIWEFSYLLLSARNGALPESETAGDPVSSSCTLVLHGEISLSATGKGQEGVSGWNAFRKKIIVYDKASQLELVSRFPDYCSFEPPMSKEVLSRYDLVQRTFPLPDNRYKDVLIFRSGYEFTDDDLIYYKKIKEAIREIEPSMEM